MERKKKTKENYPERKSSVRIWPGVLVITVCACFLFFFVNYLGFKAGLLSMPGILQSFITVQQDEGEKHGEDGASLTLQNDLKTPETEYEYYHPEREEPVALLQSLQPAQSFHQRMRFTAMSANSSHSWVTNLYTATSCWRIEQENTVFLFDGENLWRSNAQGHSYRTEIGEFTWNNQLGIPSLEELKAFGEQYPESVTFRDTERTVYMEYQPGEHTRVLCHIAVDTGLVTEMQMYVNGQQVLFMYTERISVSPDICEDKELFTWTDNTTNG